MPMSARIFSSSRSGIWSTRRPLTVMVPQSGRSSPSASLRITDLPAPLAPNRMRMSPFGTREAEVAQHHVIVEGQRDVVEDDGVQIVPAVGTPSAARPVVVVSGTRDLLARSSS